LKFQKIELSKAAKNSKRWNCNQILTNLLHLGTVVTTDPETGVIVRILNYLAEDQVQSQWMDQCVLRRWEQLDWPEQTPPEINIETLFTRHAKNVHTSLRTWSVQGTLL
jgi:hypothetical protein